MDPYFPYHAKLDDPSYYAAKAECELDQWERDSWRGPYEDRPWSEHRVARVERLALALDVLVELFALARRDEPALSIEAEQQSHWHDWHDWLGWRFFHRLLNRDRGLVPSALMPIAASGESLARSTEVELAIVRNADGRADVLPESVPTRATPKKPQTPPMESKSDGHAPIQLSR